MKNKPTKEELQKQLNAIAEQEQRDMRNEYYPMFKKHEGKTFKVRNSYGSGKKWWKYIKITTIKPSDIYMVHSGPTCTIIGWSFETDCYGKVDVEKNYRGYFHSIGKQCSNKEFDKAFNKMLDGIIGLD